LIRHVAEGRGDTLPETVLALVQSRLDGLETEARRIVRAASVFGDVFWQGGVAALLGGTVDAGDLGASVNVLVQGEIFSAASENRFLGQREYAFRHSLLREATYGMLTDADRTMGHGLAGDWLERAGETDALTLAGHFERGDALSRAVPWFLRAAEAAWEGGNMEAVIALADRGIACGPDDAERGLLYCVQTSALVQRGQWSMVVEKAREAMALLSEGSAPWFGCAARIFSAGMFLGDSSVTGPALRAMLGVSVQPEPTGSYAWAVHQTCVGLTSMGQFEVAQSFLERAEAMVQGASDPDPVFVLRLRTARAWIHLTSGEPGRTLAVLSAARHWVDRSGDSWGQAALATFSVWALAEVGSCERAEAAAREVRALSETGQPLRAQGNAVEMLAPWSYWIDYGAFGLACAMVLTDRASDAVAPLQKLLDGPFQSLASRARALLAHALVAIDDLDGGLREATAAMEGNAISPSTRVLAFAALARLELRHRRPTEALASVERGLDASASGWRFSATTSMLQLARAEAFHMLGRREVAYPAIREARDRILRVADTVEDPKLRHSYLTNIEANARTLRLAKEWLGEDAP
jgi:hypothetical protein